MPRPRPHRSDSVRLTLFRHAATQANALDIFMGGRDIPATQDALSEARRVGLTLTAADYGKVFTSPLMRAHRTCQLLFPSAQITLDVRLRERGLGVWEGRQKKELRVEYPAAFLSHGVDPTFTPPLGESLGDFLTRVAEFLNDITRADAPAVAAVTHNGVICAIRHLAEQIPSEKAFSHSVPYLKAITLTVPRCTLRP